MRPTIKLAIIIAGLCAGMLLRVVFMPQQSTRAEQELPSPRFEAEVAYDESQGIACVRSGKVVVIQIHPSDPLLVKQPFCVDPAAMTPLR